MTEPTVTHYVEVDMDGEELDCLEDCPGCAVDRVRAYLAQREPMQNLGDRIHETNGGDDAGGATLHLDDLRALVEAATVPTKVADFCAERAGFITAINNCHPDNVSDYHRWQGHAEARRQLSERLGLPTAWPPAATTQPSGDQS